MSSGVAVVNQPSVTPRTDAGVEIDFATEAKLEAVRVLLAALDAKDFATQTTLDAFLTAFNGEDFASQATLQALLTAFNNEDFSSETTLAALKAAFDAEDFASETTLVAADAKLATIDAVLDAIKDTDGIADLKKWLGSTAPTVGQKAMVASIPVTLASDQPALQVTVGVAASSGSITEFLTDDGLNTGSHDMKVNGGGTDVPFWFPADATDDIVLTGLRIVFSANTIDFDGSSFGKGSELSTGIQVNIVADNGAFVEELANITLNEDFFRLLQFSISQAGTTDAMAATLPFGGRVVLEAGTGDKVEVIIRDNMTGAALGVNYLTATLYGVKEI